MPRIPRMLLRPPRFSPGFVPALILGISASFALARADAAEMIEGKARVIDAGTLEIQGKRVRLNGIKTPDEDQACLRDAKPWKCGAAAAAALRRHVEGREVSCEAVGDDAGARCSMDGENLNALLVREGWAMDRPSESEGAYAKEQEEAKRARRGVWATEKDNPEEVRRQRMRGG